MTFINYQAWVHFADHVLEEALYAEFARENARRPVVVHDTASRDTVSMERLLSGIPPRREVAFLDVASIEADVLPRPWQKVPPPDSIVALGAHRVLAAAINLLSTLSQTTEPRQSDPLLVLIPTTLGLPLGILQGQRSPGNIARNRRDAPRVLTICDPTLTMGSSSEDVARGAVVAITRCVEALIGPAYHPPSSGVALDGLARIAKNVFPVVDDQGSPDQRRELMAGALNAALAAEQGVSTLEQFAREYSTDKTGDAVTLCRLLLPRLVAAYEAVGPLPNDAKLKNALEIPSTLSVSDGLERLLSKLPLSGDFRTAGFRPDEIVVALMSQRLAQVLTPSVLGQFTALIHHSHPVH
ncbi:MAG: iron-containing alcohol dehydrogenase [Pseudomonadota bacterium]